MSLLEYAKSELALLRDPADEPDEMQDAIEANLLAMISQFADAGHSGFSGAYALGCLTKLLAFEPLTPLTGEDDEWIEIGDNGNGPCFQNRRSPRVFKDDAGAYDIDGKVFVEPDGMAFTSRDSRVPVTFPYTPKTERVSVEARAD